jgi:predicted nucleic acid-binding protein
VPIRVYADTSVFGGILDEEFRDPTLAFLTLVHRGQLQLVTSALVALEIEGAPLAVREGYERLRPLAEVISIEADALALRHAYVAAGFVRARSNADALHVALATVARCAAIVSWNFKDIVRYDLIPRYNGVNQRLDYSPLGIHVPPEVESAFDEDLPSD